MSKMDNLRAMREARYAEMSKGGSGATKPAGAKHPAVAPPAPKASGSAEPSATTETADTEPALCGHRNMSGRTCTREAGHSAKSHRYS